MTSTAARKEMTQQYKERKTPRGVFALRCLFSGQIWVGSSPNLDAAWNSLRFQLNSAHRNAGLLAAWREHGESGFAFEVLEALPEDTDALNLQDLLKERRLQWAAELCAETV